MVKSGKYNVNRLTTNVYEDNIVYDVLNYINYTHDNAIFKTNNLCDHKKKNGVVSQYMRTGAVNSKAAQC